MFYPAALTATAGVLPWQFQPETYGAKGDGKMALVGMTSGGSTVTASSSIFVPGDVGKNIEICGGVVSPPSAPIIDTIGSYISATQVTLATQTAGVTFSGAAMVCSSDDRLAIDSCMQAAAAYAQSADYSAEIVFGDKIYGLGTGTFSITSGTTYNTQVRIPVPNPNGTTQKLEIVLKGPGDNTHEQFWLSQFPNMAGAVLKSYSVGPASPPSNGQQSIVGCPTGGAGTGSNGFFNVKPVVDGVQVWQPGWGNLIGFDFSLAGGCRVIGAGSFEFAPSSNLGSAYNPYTGWVSNTFWQAKIAIGMIVPNYQNNQDTLVESFAAGGVNTGIQTGADGPIFQRLITVSCGVSVKITNFTSPCHDLVIQRLYFENVLTCIYVPGGTPPVAIYAKLDGENASLTGFDVNDANGVLTGRIDWYDAFRSPQVPQLNGAANVEIVNDMVNRGHLSSPPAVPASGTATTAQRQAMVVVHTGVGVTVSAITVSGTSVVQTVAASSSSIPISVPTQGTITLTYAGGTPTWDWWYF